MAVYAEAEQFGYTSYTSCTILLYFMVLVSFEECKVHGDVRDSCSSWVLTTIEQYMHSLPPLGPGVEWQMQHA